MAWIEESVGPSSSSSRVHYIPLCSNTLEERMNPSLLPPPTSQLRLASIALSKKKKKSEFKYKSL